VGEIPWKFESSRPHQLCPKALIILKTQSLQGSGILTAAHTCCTEEPESCRHIRPGNIPSRSPRQPDVRALRRGKFGCVCHPKFETEAARLGGELERNDQHIDVEENLPILTIDEVCWIDRQRRMDSEHCHRREVLSGFTTRQDRLFPGLTQHTSGRYSDALSKKFARHLRDTGLKDAGLSFHSLRHTFTHKFKVAAPRDA
jgi:hypothetical protein